MHQEATMLATPWRQFEVGTRRQLSIYQQSGLASKLRPNLTWDKDLIVIS